MDEWNYAAEKVGFFLGGGGCMWSVTFFYLKWNILLSKQKNCLKNAKKKNSRWLLKLTLSLCKVRIFAFEKLLQVVCCSGQIYSVAQNGDNFFFLFFFFLSNVSLWFQSKLQPPPFFKKLNFFFSSSSLLNVNF